jgi:hypothetical protein
MKNENLFLTILEARKSKIKVSTDSAAIQGPIPHKLHLFAAFSYGRRGKAAPFNLFYKGTNPIHEGATLMT